VYGIYLTDNASRNVNTTLSNNIIYGYNNDSLIFAEKTGALTGITLANNVYYSTGTTPFGSGNATVKLYNFAGWKTNAVGDTNSLFADPQLVDVNHFLTTGAGEYLFRNADISATSPARGVGASQAFNPAINYRLEMRSTWNVGAF
jgi:hypothetical protein